MALLGMLAFLGGALALVALSDVVRGFGRFRYAGALSHCVGFVVAASLFSGARDRVDLANAAFDPDVPRMCRAVPLGREIAGVRHNALSALGALERVGRLSSATGRIGIVDGARFSTGDSIAVSGWAADPDTGAPGSALVVLVDGRARIDITRRAGLSRDALPMGSTTPSPGLGFVALVPARTIGRGFHKLGVGLVDCDRQRVFSVTGEVELEVAGS